MGWQAAARTFQIPRSHSLKVTLEIEFSPKAFSIFMVSLLPIIKPVTSISEHSGFPKILQWNSDIPRSAMVLKKASLMIAQDWTGELRTLCCISNSFSGLLLTALFTTHYVSESSRGGAGRQEMQASTSQAGVCGSLQTDFKLTTSYSPLTWQTIIKRCSWLGPMPSVTFQVSPTLRD